MKKYIYYLIPKRSHHDGPYFELWECVGGKLHDVQLIQKLNSGHKIGDRYTVKGGLMDPADFIQNYKTDGAKAGYIDEIELKEIRDSLFVYFL